MTYILSREEMREMDARTMEEFGIPSRVLMETAGARCADHVRRIYPRESSESVAVLCGSGNNGGDGYVIARHLFSYAEKILILGLPGGKMSPETAVNRELCEKLNIPIHDLKDPEELSTLLALVPQGFSLLIDAVYGIGFRGELPDVIKQVLQHFEESDTVKVAIDIPSGINANTGEGFSMQMDHTLVIEELKYGHLLGQGRARSGRVVTVPIGIPAAYKAQVKSFHYDELFMPQRPRDGHKGSFGRVIAIGGSTGYLGSIRLAATAALRAGAGLVYLYCRPQDLPHYAVHTDEVMTFPIPLLQDSSLPDLRLVQEFIDKADALVVGCGMGLDDFARTMLRAVLESSGVPTVLDADALTLISQDPGLKQHLGRGNFLLTPHKGEFCRLAGISMETLNKDPIGALTDYQKKLGCPILLKGHSSIYLDSKRCRIMTGGNDALSTGGSGDLLAGIIASLAAQGLSPDRAACSASLLLGKTAERLSLQQHSYSIIPSDIIKHLGDQDA